MWDRFLEEVDSKSRHELLEVVVEELYIQLTREHHLNSNLTSRNQSETHAMATEL